MKKYKICKILLVILSIFLCVVFYELFGICIAYKKQPEVSNTIKKETQNDSWNERSENMERAVIIEKNPEALLQRVRLIRNAKEDIILSTFAFNTFGALAIAAETYGLQGAVSLRVSQNVFGVVFTLAFCVIFYWFMPKKKESEVTVHAE